MKIISSYSIKGGVGKTALAVNMAFAFCEAGQRSLLAYAHTCAASRAYRALSDEIISLTAP
ncbi:MAG TPA: AAA family ATPase [Desulfuromonadales bacterium]|nr:AAA family ATPase [Desulfuromonadales bacterium]